MLYIFRLSPDFFQSVSAVVNLSVFIKQNGICVFTMAFNNLSVISLICLDVTRSSMVSFNDLQNDHALDARNITPSGTVGRQVPKFYPVNHSAKWGVAAFSCTIILLHPQAGYSVASSFPFIYHSPYVFLRKKITLTLSMISIMDAPIKPCRTFEWCLDWVISPLISLSLGTGKEKKIFLTGPVIMVNFSLSTIMHCIRHFSLTTWLGHSAMSLELVEQQYR